ncbi:proline iminopeptidase-family hydrolase [Massilia cavernae]|uniref:Alpha/beta fold hydrolase n=1 Tax=Massilia cavernae TaxID=2320864 RepID=A0A418XR06_9BURK|nr:proline iminopeptidase-family hydrolase [Massilia cavernae]RJG14871.1 alpha/beta fold hydrolase [Massilia cavernae]
MSIPCHETRLRLNEGHQVVTYRYGPAPSQAAQVLVCVNGGPGLPCDYLRESHKVLANDDWCIVFYDQLGCGASDRPRDNALWTLERYVAELEQIRAQLGIERFHLLGHSWGTWLGTEYCLTFPQRVLSYVAADGAADIPHLVGELQRLRQCLGEQTVSMMTRREAEGSIGHPEYQAAITILNYRHVCRLDDWPASLNASIEGWNMDPYRAIQGPNEFTYTGNMRNWNRVPAMGAITIPSLVLAGEYDELPPSCSARMQQAMPNAELVIFRDCSHMPFFERPQAYFAVLNAFLHKQTGPTD